MAGYPCPALALVTYVLTNQRVSWWRRQDSNLLSEMMHALSAPPGYPV